MNSTQPYQNPAYATGTSPPNSTPIRLYGVALLLMGVSFLRGGDTLLGVATLSTLLAWPSTLRNSHVKVDGDGRTAWSRWLSWLTTDRFQATSTAEPTSPAPAAVRPADDTDEDP